MQWEYHYLGQKPLNQDDQRSPTHRKVILTLEKWRMISYLPSDESLMSSKIHHNFVAVEVNRLRLGQSNPSFNTLHYPKKVTKYLPNLTFQPRNWTFKEGHAFPSGPGVSLTFPWIARSIQVSSLWLKVTDSQRKTDFNKFDFEPPWAFNQTPRKWSDRIQKGAISK